MLSRRLLHATMLSAALLTLAACGPDDTSAAPSSAAPSSGTTAATSPGKSAPPSDGAPANDCGTPKPVTGHKMVHVTAQPTATTLQAQATNFACDPNDGHYAGTGTAKTYKFAANAEAEVTQGAVNRKAVSLTVLSHHISDCLHGTSVQPPNYCSGDIYDITVDSAGHITTIAEIWHS
ncbi:hypothetical protein QMK19_22045 [Streptomyces sp. H10-C2]|uniref:hypothetical protein n=1 Tax=unclassified Streptomyces TaxID=2593676 RepID=UPI0024BA6EB4|nr:MULTISPECIES: hypothetical protein [unclassified Streptomyces]MDJ0342417.1 hypothetical protein [Streptomyces sp. PH10-H1]MDJ0372272.1 hypothetical protein [Streptomyces sp. H10-C2]